MKKTAFTVIAFLAVLFVSSFRNVPPAVNNFYISLKKVAKVKRTEPVQLTGSELSYSVSSGQEQVNAVAGYKLNYLNSKKAAFATVTVLLSDKDAFESNKQSVLQALQAMKKENGGEVSELNYNGYKVQGAATKGSIKEVFALFSPDDTIVLIQFNRLEGKTSNYKDEEDYLAQRNDFIGQYTAHLKNCMGK